MLETMWLLFFCVKIIDSRCFWLLTSIRKQHWCFRSTHFPTHFFSDKPRFSPWSPIFEDQLIFQVLPFFVRPLRSSFWSFDAAVLCEMLWLQVAPEIFRRNSETPWRRLSLTGARLATKGVKKREPKRKDSRDVLRLVFRNWVVGLRFFFGRCVGVVMVV